MNKKAIFQSSAARTVAFVGVMAATLECAKLVLAVLPNIEVVSLLCAIFGYVFGISGVIAAVVFVFIEPLIWGFGPWFFTYIIYWPMLAFLFMMLAGRGVKNRWIITGIALLMTLGFGVLSAVFDSIFYIGINEYYLKNLAIYYLRGLPFYALQLACNAVLFTTLFPFLSGRVLRLKQGFANGKM